MFDMPITYSFSILCFAFALLFGLLHLNKAWGLPYVAVVLTVAAWYFIEPLESINKFLLQFYSDPDDVQTAFGDVALFFITLTIVTPWLADKFVPKGVARFPDEAYVSAEQVLLAAAGLWLVLLAYGVARMGGDVFGALFPLKGRAGAQMWGRPAAAGAGPDGFIVSTAMYLYSLTLASFGVLLVLVRRNEYRAIAIILILISWPYVFLQGARNVALSVIVPGAMCFLLFSRRTLLVRCLVCGLLFMGTDLAMKIIIFYRNVGFENVNISSAETAQQLGLNMGSELVYCIEFIRNGTLQVGYGKEYILELANVIPRAIWPGKPLLGIDYAIARGFGGGNNDIGVIATVSTGVIGQAVLNFGPLFGPIAAAILMGSWASLLGRLTAQGTVLRRSLFLVGLGLTFNLGRDVTLLVLWPMVFGYIVVRIIERRQRSRSPIMTHRSTGSALPLAPSYGHRSVRRRPQ